MLTKPVSRLMLMALCGLSGAAGRAAEYQPAAFADDLATHVLFPEESGNIIVSVPCSAKVSEAGRLLLASCFVASEKAQPFANAVLQGTEEVRLVPARVDGVPKAVLMHFAVRFEKFNESSAVTVTMNHGGHAALYGADYVDVQVVDEAGGARPDWPDCAAGLDLLWVSALVMADSRPLRPKVLADRIKPKCRRLIAQDAGRWRFIPAFAQGRPVDAFIRHPLLRTPQRITRVDASKVTIE